MSTWVVHETFLQTNKHLHLSNVMSSGPNGVCVLKCTMLNCAKAHWLNRNSFGYIKGEGVKYEDEFDFCFVRPKPHFPCTQTEISVSFGKT